MIEAGTFLQNRYRVEKQIGQGGMGAVFVATDERFGSTVAIKETLFTDKNLLKAFEREARLLNSLRHPALPRVSDYFIEECGQFIVMEYITGEDLSEKMERYGKAFPLEDVLNWSNQLLDALEYLHSQEMPVIHRDIKPQNLKLTPRGQIILLDFGLAKGNPTDASHKTAAKSIFGYSRSYASLEQMQGTGTEPRSDLYSLGATVYHLLTGIPPADALTRAMNVLNGQADPLVSADLVHSQVPKGVARVLQKAMALNANERPESAESLRQMLIESDKETVADDEVETFVSPLRTDLLTQKTKIMSATTADGAGEQTINRSEAATEVVPEITNDESALKTNVLSAGDATATARGGASTTETGGRRRSLAVAAALGILLLVGSAISAIYVYKTGKLRSSKPSSSVNTANTNNNSEIVSSATNVEAVNDNTADSNLANAETVKETTASTAPNGDAKTKLEVASKTDEASKKATVPKTQIGEYTVVDEDDPEAGNVTVKGDRVETDHVIVDSNKIIIKKNPRWQYPNANTIPPPLPPNLRGLTPEQKQKLRELIKKQREIQMQKQREMQMNRQSLPKPPQQQNTPPNN
jgi:serine/threonine protein kinase